MSTIYTATDKAANSVRNLTEEVLQSAEDAVKSTRNKANTAFDKAETGVQHLRDGASPAIDELAAKAQHLAARGIDYCAETSAKARQQLQNAADTTVRYVTEQPGKSLLIAATAGAALAMLCMAVSRRRY